MKTFYFSLIAMFLLSCENKTLNNDISKKPKHNSRINNHILKKEKNKGDSISTCDSLTSLEFKRNEWITINKGGSKSCFKFSSRNRLNYNNNIFKGQIIDSKNDHGEKILISPFSKTNTLFCVITLDDVDYPIDLFLCDKQNHQTKKINGLSFPMKWLLFSPDEKFIVFATYFEGISNLYLYNINDEKLKEINLDSNPEFEEIVFVFDKIQWIDNETLSINFKSFCPRFDYSNKDKVNDVSNNKKDSCKYIYDDDDSYPQNKYIYSTKKNRIIKKYIN